MFNKSTILKARTANLPEYLRAKGHTLIKEGRQFRVVGASGLVVSDNYWFNHVQQRGGNALDYAIQMERMRFTDAVSALICHSNVLDGCACTAEVRHRLFRPPPKNSSNTRVISYLVKTRGIRYDVLHTHIVDGRIYEARGSRNCVFTGIDHDTSEIRYAFQRSSLRQSRIMFESTGSDKRYSFSLPGTSETLLVFESVIDLFSYMSMAPGEVHKGAFWLSLGGLNNIALDHLLRKWNGLSKIIFCLDSDSAADEVYTRIGEKYVMTGYSVSRHIPIFKDWNEQLLRSGYSFPGPPEEWGVAS